MQAFPKRKRAKSPIEAASAPRLDFWMVLDLLANRWRWLAVGAALCSLAALAAANKLVGPKFTATAQLLRYATPGLNDFFKRDGPMSPDTFAGLIRAPDLLQRVGEKAVPPIPPETFAKQIKVDPDAESDLVNIALAAPNPQQAVELLNIYLTNAVDYLRALQSQEVRLAADSYLGKQVGQMDQDIVDLDKEFRTLAMPPQITNKVAQIGGQLTELSHTLAGPPRASPVLAMETERLNLALGELTGLLSKFTEIHPLVQQKEAEVKALKAQIATDSTNTITTPAIEAAIATTIPAPPPAPAPTLNPEVDIIRAKLLSLEEGRVQLVNRQREAELYVANPPGEARVFAPATLKTVQSGHRRMKIALATVVGACLGLAGSLILVLLAEFVDGRLKTVEDVRRVTQLPVLTTLGDVRNMGAEAQSQWAFRTWTLLQGLLSPTAHHGLVCGFTSSSQGEGRSTWIRLLADAASLTGFRVLTVETRRPNEEGKPGAGHACDLLPESLQAKEPGEGLMARDMDALSSPAQVTDRLTDPNLRPVVHIPLPGWVWNRERRQQWEQALDHWRKIENIVILVELPPADMPETVLLGASVPNVIWLAQSGAAEAANTRDQLETLRHARCNMVGAVLNRDLVRTMKRRFPRWITCLALLAWLGHPAAQAQPTNPAPAVPSQTNNSFSIVHPWQRAAWQDHLTLGPGDVLSFGLFGQPELAALEVALGPDGRVSFLEAQDILATGLTIDELRARLDEELGKYHRAPHTLITPVAFRSMKYFMLGKVMVKGAYVLDRPLTVLEAIARAKGFENGLVNRSVVDLADFSHSFLARDGKRLPLNFEKLFESGDLSQNIPIEPGDYIYIAAAKAPEVYVVGEVRLPGPVAYSAGQTIIGAITARGGFTQRAWHSRVLIVRGSLNQPECLAVDTAAIVRGKTNDFRLQPRDIIFVSHRPFVRVEELADLATTAFIQGLITAWVDVKVVKPFVSQ
jgi:protein involved in polysaccharide export with SLBB domain/capsular polysaccharide biosynthesis protein